MSISIIIAGLVTGMLLGVFGSGGSIITMPALLYLLDVEPKSAIAMSLGIVAITATITAMQHWRHGNVDLRITAIFGLFGVLGTYLGYSARCLCAGDVCGCLENAQTSAPA